MRSVIDYCSIAYNSASISTKNKLDIIEHKALRIACGAFCSTAASALQVETGELPLDLRRSQQEIQYALKINPLLPKGGLQEPTPSVSHE